MLISFDNNKALTEHRVPFLKLAPCAEVMCKRALCQWVTDCC